MESLAPEVAPFGIRTMLVEPGFFRTELLTEDSTKYLADDAQPPARWPAGADAVGAFEQKAQSLLEQANAHRDLSSSLAHDDTSGVE
jgi:NAD(P)-dependent dehydrogenase (short-subunit alcohol dehydrogenase family)